MTFAVKVESTDDRFTAVLLGAPDVQSTGTTADEAVDGLRKEIERRTNSGCLRTVDVPTAGLSTFAGRFRDDPTLREICEEAYRLRDEEV
jgi:hypothetical protein